MLKPMREIAVRRSFEALAARIQRRRVRELQQPRRQRRLGADDLHHVLDFHLFVGQRAAHAHGHVGKARQVDLLARELDVSESTKARASPARGTGCSTIRGFGLCSCSRLMRPLSDLITYRSRGRTIERIRRDSGN